MNNVQKHVKLHLCTSLPPGSTPFHTRNQKQIRFNMMNSNEQIFHKTPFHWHWTEHNVDIIPKDEKAWNVTTGDIIMPKVVNFMWCDIFSIFFFFNFSYSHTWNIHSWENKRAINWSISGHIKYFNANILQFLYVFVFIYSIFFHSFFLWNFSQDFQMVVCLDWNINDVECLYVWKCFFVTPISYFHFFFIFFFAISVCSKTLTVVFGFDAVEFCFFYSFWLFVCRHLIAHYIHLSCSRAYEWETKNKFEKAKNQILFEWSRTKGGILRLSLFTHIFSLDLCFFGCRFNILSMEWITSRDFYSFYSSSNENIEEWESVFFVVFFLLILNASSCIPFFWWCFDFIL